MYVRDIIFVVVFCCCLPICFFRPFFGVLMWTVVSFLNPHTFVWSLGWAYPWAAAVATATVGGALLFERNWRNLWSWEVFLIAVLWMWFTFTTVYDTNLSEFAEVRDDTWFRYRFVSKILLMVIVTAAVVNTRERLRWLLCVIAGSFGFLVIKAVPFIILTGGQYRVYGSNGTMVADNNDVGLALNMTLPIFFFLAKAESGYLKRCFGILFVATIPTIFFTYSRGALLGLGAVLIGMLMTLRQRLVLIPILLLAGAFGVFFTPDHWRERMDFSNEAAVIDASARSRFNAWTYCWRLALDHPLTGGGFDAFTKTLFERYAPDASDVHGPHSIYFGVLAEHGFVGLGLYLVVVLAVFHSLFRIGKGARQTGDEATRIYSVMLRFSLIGFLVSGAFLGRAYFDYYFTLVACCAILKRLSQDDSSQPVEEYDVVAEELPA